jgi:polyisoprenyl-phosphate glycosyltransferase
VAAAISVAMRLFTGLATPGWATTVVGISFVILLQLLTMMTALTFVMLSNRMAAPVIPALHARHYIASIDRVV